MTCVSDLGITQECPELVDSHCADATSVARRAVKQGQGHTFTPQSSVRWWNAPIVLEYLAHRSTEITQYRLQVVYFLLCVFLRLAVPIENIAIPKAKGRWNASATHNEQQEVHRTEPWFDQYCVLFQSLGFLEVYHLSRAEGHT